MTTELLAYYGEGREEVAYDGLFSHDPMADGVHGRFDWSEEDLEKGAMAIRRRLRATAKRTYERSKILPDIVYRGKWLWTDTGAGTQGRTATR